MNTINRRIITFVFVAVSSVACTAPAPRVVTPAVAATVGTTNTVTPPSTPTRTITQTREPTETPERISARPTPSKPAATPIPPHRTPEISEGYWIQNTTEDGLCSDSPRFIGYDDSNNRAYIGDDHSTICYLGSRALEYWPYEYGSGGPGAFPSWHTKKVPQIGRVTGAGDLRASTPEWAAYGMPSFVGTQGKCVLESEGDYPDVKGKWRCLTAAEGLPFNDIRDYDTDYWSSNVEWLMSSDSVSSRGLAPQDQTYFIPELVGVSNARPIWLNANRFGRIGVVWIGTNGYGMIRIEPSKQSVTRYTTADGLPSNVVYDALCNETCTMVATDRGIGYWNGERWQTYTVEDGLPSNEVYGLSAGRIDDKLTTWAATANGPALLATDSNYWQSFPSFPAQDAVTDVETDGSSAGGIFSTQGHGLIKFVQAPAVRGNATSLTASDGLPSNHITALAATANGILIGTSRGAVEWDGKTWLQITDELINDVSGNLIATDSGLWAWDGNAWTKVNDDSVTLVAEDGWYATLRTVCRWANGKLNCPATSDGQALLDAKTLYVDPVSREVFALDRNNNPWKYDAGANHFVAGTDDNWFPDYLPDTIHDMVAQSSEWQYATDVGVYFVPFDSEEGINGVPNPDYTLTGGWPVQVRKMSLDTATGVTWLATNQGAFYSDEERGWVYVAGLPSRNITAVLATSDAIWFGTADKGLIRFTPSMP